MAGLIDYRMGSGATKGKESKRQQARNERALQDLIKGVPGNDACADCGSRNPAWASWSVRSCFTFSSSSIDELTLFAARHFPLHAMRRHTS